MSAIIESEESENSQSSDKGVRKFVDDWLIYNTILGEGAFGE